MAETLEKELQEKCTVTSSLVPDPEADLNFHMTWWPNENRVKTKIDVGRFTHLNPIYAFDVDEALGFFDHLVAITQHGKQILIDRGISPENITAISAGVDGFVPRKINVGISGQPYQNYRKRECLIAELHWIMKPEDFYSLNWIFLGPNWEGVVSTLRAQGASVQYDPKISYDDYPQVFAAFDIYVNCAFAEGGPLGVIQALACGIPVISPNHGYGYDLDTLHFEDAKGLAGHLETLIRKPKYTQTWKKWAEDHLNLFGGLWNEA